MELFGINTTEFLIVLVLAMLVIGPDKLPEYVQKLREGITKAREMADGARSQLKDQMGPEFEDINWRQYDPRQYDPRAIVRQALFDEPRPEDPAAAQTMPDRTPDHVPETPAQPEYLTRFDPDRATPWDIDAT